MINDRMRYDIDVMCVVVRSEIIAGPMDAGRVPEF